MKILNTSASKGLITINCSKMEETLDRYNMKLEDLDAETLATFTKLSEYNVILSLAGMRIRESIKSWVDNSGLLYLEDVDTEREYIVGRSNKDKDTDCIRVNCLFAEVYYLLAQFLPHNYCMDIMREYLPLIKDSAFLTDVVGNFQVQSVPEFVLNEKVTDETNILKEDLELLELKGCPIKHISYDGTSIIMATKDQAYRCFLNHFAIKGFAKTSAKRVYGKSKTELKSVSKHDIDLIEELIEMKTPNFYAYTLLCYIGYMCILIGGGINMMPTNSKLFGKSPTMTLTNYFMKYCKEN